MPPKVRYFYWLVLHDRCWTAARRKRRGLQDSDDCALCSVFRNHRSPSCRLRLHQGGLVRCASGLWAAACSSWHPTSTSSLAFSSGVCNRGRGFRSSTGRCGYIRRLSLSGGWYGRKETQGLVLAIREEAVQWDLSGFRSFSLQVTPNPGVSGLPAAGFLVFASVTFVFPYSSFGNSWLPCL